MKQRLLSRKTGSPLIVLGQDRGSSPGLSSYRATLESFMFPVFMRGRDAIDFTDEEWLRLFSGRLLFWFQNERNLLAPDSPALLELEEFKVVLRQLYEAN